MSEGRRIVHEEAEKTNKLVEANYQVFTEKLSQLTERAEREFMSQLTQTQKEFKESLQMVNYLEVIECAHQQIFQLLLRLSTGGAGAVGGSGRGGAGKRVVFQCIGSNSADYLMLATTFETIHQQIAGHTSKSQAGRPAGRPSSRTGRLKQHQESSNDSASTDAQSHGIFVPNDLELAKLYKILTVDESAGAGRLSTDLRYLLPTNNNNSSELEGWQRIYTVVDIDELEAILTAGAGQSTLPLDECHVFSNDLALIASLYQQKTISVTALEKNHGRYLDAPGYPITHPLLCLLF